MEQEKFKWVKQDLLPLFGLLDFVEKEENGFFSLPLSKENLIRNLIRITRKPKSVIERELEDFEKNFDDYIEIKDGTYSYRTGCTIRNHPPSRSPCPTPEKSTIYYILKSELVSTSRNEIEKLDSEPEKIFNEIISRVQTIEDLIYISLLKYYITEKCLLHDYYPFESDANSDLKEIMEIANIDKEIIEYALKYNSPFVLDYEKMNKFLPKDQKCFVIFYSHSFNTSSCYRIINIYIKKEIAQYIYEKLEKIHIIENMERLYKELKQQIMANEERLPLFNYKDYRSKFIHKYYLKLTKGIEKLYEFEIDEEDLRKALKFFEDKRIVEIKDDEIILLSKDKFIALHNDLIDREDQRIKKNKKELLMKWLMSSASLELLETGVKDIKPKAPVYKAIESGLEKKRSPEEDAYDVVLSFAGEDREYVEAVAEYLKNNNVKVFYDEYEEVKLWGKDLPEYLDKVYRGSAQYCVIFISKNYANKVWTRHEKQSALAKAIEEKKEYILPARFDNTEIPGIRPTVHYVDLSKKTPKQLGEMILQKLGREI